MANMTPEQMMAEIERLQTALARAEAEYVEYSTSRKDTEVFIARESAEKKPTPQMKGKLKAAEERLAKAQAEARDTFAWIIAGKPEDWKSSL